MRGENSMNNLNLESLNDIELIKCYSNIIKELKYRKIITTKNVTGEIGEHLVIDYYNNHVGLPKLIKAITSTANIDAIGNNGERYSIKSISTKTTGSFFGLEPVGSNKVDQKVFEHVIICKFDDDFELKGIYEIDWNVFLKYKKWQSRMNSWYLTLTKALIDESKVIFEYDSN